MFAWFIFSFIYSLYAFASSSSVKMAYFDLGYAFGAAISSSFSSSFKAACFDLGYASGAPIFACCTFLFIYSIDLGYVFGIPAVIFPSSSFVKTASLDLGYALGLATAILSPSVKAVLGYAIGGPITACSL